VTRIGLVGLFLIASLPAMAMPLCSAGERHTCVVDGDTVWISGEKIRLADIDTPEPSGRCVTERVLAARAAGRLAELLSGPHEIVRGDPADGRLQDRYGRTLAVIRVGGVSVGTILVREGLARPWTGRRSNWC
jgi:micrococcal nuclease